MTHITPIKTDVALQGDFVASTTKQAKTKRKRIAPLSIRVTHEEREWLIKASGNMSVNAYVKQCVFHANDNVPAKLRKGSLTQDRKSLAQILGKLARLDIFSTIKGLFKAMESGHLHLKPETEDALRQACSDIREIRRMLITALGIKAE